MKTTTLVSSLILVTVTGCNILGSTDTNEADLFGAWYKVETVENNYPGPDQRVLGWYISDDGQPDKQTVGSFHPLGIEGNTGIISVIDQRFLPSHTLQIHEVRSDTIIIDHFDHITLASKEGASKSGYHAISDLYLTRDTVTYSVSSDRLILEGKFYKGTYQRAALGSRISDPVHALWQVSIDGKETENLQISETTPSAYISRISGNKLRIISRMGWQNISIEIPDFDGPGTYIIGPEQASYTTRGFDTLSPSYVTTTDTAGVVTIESIDITDNRMIGNFEFTAHMGEINDEPEFQKHLTNGSFNLPVYE